MDIKWCSIGLTLQGYKSMYILPSEISFEKKQFFPFPNALAEYFCISKFYPSQTSILFFIIRKTYGWVDKKTPEGRKRFRYCSYKEMRMATGIQKQQNLKRELDKLIDLNVIKVLNIDTNGMVLSFNTCLKDHSPKVYREEPTFQITGLDSDSKNLAFTDNSNNLDREITIIPSDNLNNLKRENKEVKNSFTVREFKPAKENNKENNKNSFSENRTPKVRGESSEWKNNDEDMKKKRGKPSPEEMFNIQIKNGNKKVAISSLKKSIEKLIKNGRIDEANRLQKVLDNYMEN